jgi:hypothetical protein
MSTKKETAVQTLTLDLDVLRWGGACQLRAEVDEDHVQRLAEALDKDPAGVPAIGVLYDSRHYWVWDGNHRILAAQRIGAEKIRCLVESGTERDAKLRAAGANATHGLPRTAGDKRCAVTALLADKQWGKRSDRWIADACRVSATFVGKVRAEWEAKEAKYTDESTVHVDSCQPASSRSTATDGQREGRDGRVRQLPERTPERAPLLDLPLDTPASKPERAGTEPGELLSSDLARKIRNTVAAGDPKQVARLARLARQDPELAATVADMLHDGEVQSVEEALVESSAPEDPQQEASAVLKEMLAKVQSAWRVACPQKACPSLGAAVLEYVAEDWLNGGWVTFGRRGTK